MKHKFQLLMGSVLILASSMSAQVSAAGATGRLSCMDATTTSILIYVEFSNAGTTSANLYRYGAASAVATYPNKDSGKGSAQDSGLAAGHSYSYELRSGSQVLDTKTCSTKSEPAPAPAPTPAQTQPTSTPSSGTSSGSTTPRQTSGSTTTRTSGTVSNATVTSGGQATTPTNPDPATIPETDSPIDTIIKAKPSHTNAGGEKAHSLTAKPTGNKAGAVLRLTGLAIIIVAALLYIRGRRKDETALPADTDIFTTPPAPLATPSETDSMTPPIVPPPLAFSPIEEVEQPATQPYFPWQSAPPAPPAEEAAPLPSDMYEIAQKYPESFGNPLLADTLPAAEAAEAQPEPAKTPKPSRSSTPVPASDLHRPAA